MKDPIWSGFSIYWLDRWLFGSFLALLAMGVLMVASASMVISDRIYGNPFHYFIHELIYLVCALIIAGITAQCPIKLWQKFSKHFLWVSFLLLILVLIPGISHVINGSRRWLNLGITTLQVSELAKIAFIIYLADYLMRFRTGIKTKWWDFVKPLFILVLLAIPMLMEPDFGAVAVISVSCLLLLYIAGARLLPFLIIALVFAGLLGSLAIISPYRLERLTTFLHPWHTQFGSGYQLTQSLIAFGRGGIFGVGLGNSIEKLFYLPEAHTDFIFAVIGEELGLVGELLFLLGYCILVTRMLVIGYRAIMNDHQFAGFLCYGIALLISLSALINIGVNIGILPTKGLTLPFISYGGTSIIMNCFAVALVMRVAYETVHVHDKISFPNRNYFHP